MYITYMINKNFNFKNQFSNILMGKWMIFHNWFTQQFRLRSTITGIEERAIELGATVRKWMWIGIYEEWLY